jgi:hypothetical protein
MPLRLFMGTVAVGIFLSGAAILGGVLLLFGFAWSFAARAFGEEKLPGWFGMPSAYYRDAFFIGAGGSAFLIGLRRVLDYASGRWPTLHRGIPASFGEAYDAIYPGIGVLGSAMFRGLLMTGLVLLAATFAGAELRTKWVRIALFFAVVAATVSSWGSPGDFVKQFLIAAITLATVVFGVKYLVRFNLLGLFLIVMCTSLLAAASELVSQPNSFYRTNGYGLVAAVILLLAWPLATWGFGRQGTVAADC